MATRGRGPRFAPIPSSSRAGWSESARPTTGGGSWRISRAALAIVCTLTTDGHRASLSAVGNTFGPDVDFAMLHKNHGPAEGHTQPQRLHRRRDSRDLRRPEPAADLDQLRRASEPDDADGDAPLTRLTNGFSKKIENLAHAVSLHYMHYNFARVHSSLTIENADGTRMKQTPAMAAGVAAHVWTLREIAAVLEADLATRLLPKLLAESA
jgi:hypothetical protein